MDYRGSQNCKTKQIYNLIEEFYPHGNYIELFGRNNNLRNGWFTLGNQIFSYVNFIYYLIDCSSFGNGSERRGNE